MVEKDLQSYFEMDSFLWTQMWILQIESPHDLGVCRNSAVNLSAVVRSKTLMTSSYKCWNDFMSPWEKITVWAVNGHLNWWVLSLRCHSDSYSLTIRLVTMKIQKVNKLSFDFMFWHRKPWYLPTYSPLGLVMDGLTVKAFMWPSSLGGGS